MLGTNDLKHRINASAAEIAAGAGMLADIVAGSGCGPNGSAPQALLVCPPPIALVDELDDEFEGGEEKSRQLAGHFAAIAEARSCAFFDAGALIAASDVDGVHLDESAHARLGEAIAEHVRLLTAD
jgi:lysophospholipase L1-like esterase